jgi:hypothetical protein
VAGVALSLSTGSSTEVLEDWPEKWVI